MAGGFLGLLFVAVGEVGVSATIRMEGQFLTGEEAYSLADKKHKIYAKKPGPTRLPAELGPIDMTGVWESSLKEAMPVANIPVDMDREIDRMILARHPISGVLRLRPYRTADNRIEGVVMALVDITESKLAAERLQTARCYAQELVAIMHEPLVVLDGRACVLATSSAFLQYSRITASESLDRSLYEVGGGRWNIPRLRQLLDELLVKQAEIRDYMVEQDIPRGHHKIRINARRVSQADNEAIVLLAMEDVIDGTGP